VSELVWRILSAAPLVGLAWLTVRIVKRANEPQRGFNTDVVWSRIGAHLLDWILIGVAWICGMASTYQLSISLGFTDSTRLVWDNTLGNTGLFAIAIGDIVLLQAATGYTWGKRILRIRTVNSDGCRPGLRATHHPQRAAHHRAVRNRGPVRDGPKRTSTSASATAGRTRKSSATARQFPAGRRLTDAKSEMAQSQFAGLRSAQPNRRLARCR
jgi:hypothetical protein